MKSANEIIIRFDEPLDSADAFLWNFSSLPSNLFESSLLPPLFNLVSLKSSNPFQQSILYSLQVPSLKDCRGNLSKPVIVKAGLPVEPVHLNVIITEILFNPRAGGTDYVEIYNNSNSVIDLRSLFAGSRSNSGQVTSPIQISREHFHLLPGEYCVLSEDIRVIQDHYPAATALFQVSALPPLPDGSGNLVLLNTTGDIVDELHYDEDWHFDLLGNYDGVSLERIDFNKPTQRPSIWHSAAGNVGYGTPGYRNSQFYSVPAAHGIVSLPKEFFSPDNNGLDDYLIMNYEFQQAGFVLNITAFDLAGRPVRLICRNELCGMAGYYRWDGLDDSGQPLRRGIYILLFEYFNLSGKKGRIKKSVTLARDF
jgi:hypothetical protein